MRERREGEEANRREGVLPEPSLPAGLPAGSPPRSVQDTDDLETIEIHLLTEGIHRHYGFDFRDYSLPSLRRRIWKRVLAEGLDSVTALTARILHDPKAMERLLLDLTIHTTAMFRDPTFYRRFREKVVPLLRTYPFVRIWHAGCSTGEEVYSMAILLTEEGLYGRCRIYATDINEAVLDRARAGIFPLSTMQENTSNYIAAGGGGTFSDYYTARYDHAIFRPSLRDNVVFAQHNLVTDAAFNHFNVVLCRNVLIYFNTSLQERVQKLFLSSLEMFGILGLGKKETIRYMTISDHYEELDAEERLYRRVR
ncbi:MAG TPA: protein-glutamate O-methyltransferase CheR [Thermoanaerobaculia bacterium]|nr:protein-glutamate O-methyltransferase CheR [Thermoanaerobaculia bacterium]